MSQLAQLAKPFPARLVHQRTVGGGRQADYVSASSVIEKLLAVVGPFGWQVQPVPTDGGQFVMVGTLTVNIDGTTVQVQGIGEGDDAKSCESDAIKRAARMVGVGLHLWSGDDYSLHRALTRTEEVDHGGS